jgi:signal transduction histidine kinase
VVRDTVDELNQAHPDRDIRWCGDDGVDLHGVFDGDRMAQAVSNLVGNAVQHGTDPIAIDGLDAGDAVILEVRSGGAIAHDRLTRLFDPYFSTTETTAKGRSLGLGLYIVQEIARAHGGRIEVESSAERGTCFRLWLPRSR